MYEQYIVAAEDRRDTGVGLDEVPLGTNFTSHSSVCGKILTFSTCNVENSALFTVVTDLSFECN